MTIPDLGEVSLGILLAPMVLLAPGFFWSRLLAPGPMSGVERAAWSLTLSLALTPVLAYNFFLLFPHTPGWSWAFALLQTLLPALLPRPALSAPSPAPPADLAPRRLWIFPVLMAALALAAVMDVEWKGFLYRGLPSADYVKHVAVTDSIERTGIHPANPAFYPGRPLPLFYYLFWFVLCSLVDALSFWTLGPRAAVQALTAWGALGLFAVVFLLARRFLRPATGRSVGICFALLFVSGLDLLPVAFWSVAGVEPGRLFWRDRLFLHPSVDTWNWVGQINSWLETVVWVPHHLAGLVAGMTGLLVVFSSGAPRWLRVGLFAAAAASATGLSIWVTVVFGGFWLVWTAVALRRGWREDLQALIPGAVAGLLLLVPFLYHLSRTSLDARFPLAFDVRDFGFWRTYTLFRQWGAWREITDLAWLGPAYFLELGIFLVGGWWWWRRRPRPLEKFHLALVVLAAVSVGMASLLRSAVHHNDFGWRGVLPLQLVLLLASAAMLDELWRLRRRPVLTAACLALGFAAVASDWVLLTAFPAVQDQLRNNGRQGRRNLEMKRFYERLQAATGPAAVLQHNPDVPLAPDHAFYARRQAAVLDRANAGIFGTQGPELDQAVERIAAVFGPDAGAAQILDTARSYRIQVLVVQDTDPGWQSSAWQDPARFRLVGECEFARAYAQHFPIQQ